jgi:hypothetical protein
VLNPDGKPQAGAELVLVGQEKTAKTVGRTGADGRFEVAAPRRRGVILAARAAGAGIDFIDLGRAPPGAVELRLVKDHAIRGRVISTEGKPVAGVTVTVQHLGVFKGNSLDSFLAAWKTTSPHEAVASGVKHLWVEGVFTATRTDREGRFIVAGTGAERLVTLRLRGAGIAEEEVRVVNRAGFDPKPYNQAADASRMRLGPGKWLLDGPAPSVVAEREKPIRGVVKDIDTGKPRVGVKVHLTPNGNNLVATRLATTDAHGRYEIHGARKARAYTVGVDSDLVSGHVARHAIAADTPGYGPITLDLAVKKGVIITGRVLDRSTGKPLPGFAMVSVLADNPHAKDYPGLSAFATWRPVNSADGTFRVVTIPGPVVLMGGPDTRHMPEGEIGRYRYRPALPDPKYPKYFEQRAGQGYFFALGGFAVSLQGNFCKVLVIEPGTRTVKQDVILEQVAGPAIKLVDFGPLDR